MKAPLLFLTVVALGALPLARGQDSPPSENIRSLIEKYAEKMEIFRVAMDKLPREEKRAYYEEHFPKPTETGEALKKLAEAHPEAKAVPDAYAWLISRMRNGDTTNVAKVLETHHLENPALAKFALAGAFSKDEEISSLIKKLSETAANPQTKAAASFAISQKYAYSQDEEEIAKRLALLKTAQADIGDLELRGRKISKLIDSALFEVEKLKIGAVAPEIEGDDLHGKPMKLSDFKGKVVVLDFWGDW